MDDPWLHVVKGDDAIHVGGIVQEIRPRTVVAITSAIVVRAGAAYRA